MKKIWVITVAALSAGVLGMSASAERVDKFPVNFMSSETIDQNPLVMESFKIKSVNALETDGDTSTLNRITFDFLTNTTSDVELALSCYDSMGMPIETLDFDYKLGYVDVQNHTAMIEIAAKYPDEESESYLYCNYVSVYSNDGRILGIHDLLVPAHNAVGWYLPVTLYAEDGRTLDVPPYAVEAFNAVGWYNAQVLYDDAGKAVYVSPFLKDKYIEEGLKEPIMLYDLSGEIIEVSPDDVDKYKEDGWLGKVTLYSMDKRTIDVAPFDVEAFKAVGWYEAVTMYSEDGKTIDVPPYDVEAFENVGWFKPVTLYHYWENVSAEGTAENFWEEKEVSPFDVDNYKNDGWLEKVTLYTMDDDRTVSVAPYDVEAFKSVGWYTYEDVTFKKTVEPSYLDYKARGLNYQNLRLVEKWLPTFYGTEYEKALYDIKSEAIALWYQKVNYPIAYTGMGFDIYTDSAKVNIAVTNVSYKTITEFNIDFNVYDADGNRTGTNYEYYSVKNITLEPGETATYVWKNNKMVNPASIGEYEVVKVVFADGTEWHEGMQNN